MPSRTGSGGARGGDGEMPNDSSRGGPARRTTGEAEAAAVPSRLSSPRRRRGDGPPSSGSSIRWRFCGGPMRRAQRKQLQQLGSRANAAAASEGVPR
jgi:hypothetical protein